MLAAKKQPGFKGQYFFQKDYQNVKMVSNPIDKKLFEPIYKANASITGNQFTDWYLYDENITAQKRKFAIQVADLVTFT